MAQTLTAAGFVVTGDIAIMATATTCEAAWAAFERDVGYAALDAYLDDQGIILTAAERTEQLRHGFKCVAATAALLAEVDARGGAIDFIVLGGVACTMAEASDEDEDA